MIISFLTNFMMIIFVFTLKKHDIDAKTIVVSLYF